MALKGTISAYITGREYRIEWSAVQSVSENKSTITCVHKLISNATYALDIGARTVSCKVGDDSKNTASPAIDTGGGTTITLGTTKHTVTHKSDGTKSVNIEGVFYIQATLSGVYRESITASGTVDLDAIPRVSKPTVSATSVQMLSDVTIYTNRNSTAFTHELRYSIETANGLGIRGTIATGVEDSYKWTVPDIVKDVAGNFSVPCTITCKTYNGSSLVGTATTQITVTVPLATVPKLSVSTVEMGKDQIAITLNRNAEEYTLSLTYSLYAYGGSEVLATSTKSNITDGVYLWTVPLHFAAKVPGDTKATVVFTCKTWLGDTLVGDPQDVSITATVPDNKTTKPQVTMTVSPVSELSSAFDGVYVAGKTKVKVAYTATSDYSTIKSYKTEVLDHTSSSNPYTTPILNSGGKVKVKGTVTDARGYSTVVEEEISVSDYSRPRIIPGSGKNSIVCARCNSDGNLDPGGVWLLIRIGRKYSKVVADDSQKNFCKLSYQWKTDAAGEGDYSEPAELLAKDAKTDYVSAKLPNIVSSVTTAYNIRLIAEDDIGETDTVTMTVPTAFASYHVPIGGHGFTMGGYHDPAKYNVFDCRFDAEFQGDVSGRVFGMGKLPVIPEGADVNDYKEFGVYAVTGNNAAKTIANLPDEAAGTLRVWSANGKGSTSTGEYIYIMQEYIPYDNYATYRRKLQLQGESWEYGVWKVAGGHDAIVSEGITDDWYWRKYANGIAECWRRVKNEARDIDTQFGSMYYANCDEVTFPFGFYSAPVVNATVESVTALTLMSWQGTDGNGTTTASKPASYRVIRPTTITGASFTIAYHAIGRWK